VFNIPVDSQAAPELNELVTSARDVFQNAMNILQMTEVARLADEIQDNQNETAMLDMNENLKCPSKTNHTPSNFGFDILNSVPPLLLHGNDGWRPLDAVIHQFSNSSQSYGAQTIKQQQPSSPCDETLMSQFDVADAMLNFSRAKINPSDMSCMYDMVHFSCSRSNLDPADMIPLISHDPSVTIPSSVSYVHIEEDDNSCSIPI
jgi:hypothetical protein